MFRCRRHRWDDIITFREFMLQHMPVLPMFTDSVFKEEFEKRLILNAIYFNRHYKDVFCEYTYRDIVSS